MFNASFSYLLSRLYVSKSAYCRKRLYLRRQRRVRKLLYDKSLPDDNDFSCVQKLNKNNLIDINVYRYPHSLLHRWQRLDETTEMEKEPFIISGNSNARIVNVHYRSFTFWHPIISYNFFADQSEKRVGRGWHLHHVPISPLTANLNTTSHCLHFSLTTPLNGLSATIIMKRMNKSTIRTE